MARCLLTYCLTFKHTVTTSSICRQTIDTPILLLKNIKMIFEGKATYNLNRKSTMNIMRTRGRQGSIVNGHTLPRTGFWVFFNYADISLLIFKLSSTLIPTGVTIYGSRYFKAKFLKKTYLSRLSCPSWPVPAVLFKLTCPAALSWLSCHGCLVPVVLIRLSWLPAMESLSRLFCTQPSCPCSSYPVFCLLTRLFCPDSPVPAVLSRMSCPGCLFPIHLSRISCLGCSTTFVLSWLSYPSWQSSSTILSQRSCCGCPI